MEILKNVLKDKRKQANLSYNQIAEHLNITPDAYSKIERGDRNPSLKVFARLATILDIDMNILKAEFRDA